MNYTSPNYKKISYLAATVIVISLAVTVIVVVKAKDTYPTLFILPLVFGFCTLLFSSVYNLYAKSIAYTLMLSLLILKNVVMPLFMALGDGSFNAKINTVSYFDGAVALEILEFITVYFVLYHYYTKVKDSYFSATNDRVDVSTVTVRSFTKLTVILFIFVLLLIILYPQLLYYLEIGVSSDTSKIVSANLLKEQIRESVPTNLYYLFVYSINLLRWAVPITVIFKSYIKENVSEWVRIFISFIVVIISAVLTTDTIAVSLFIMVTMSSIIIRLYPEKKSALIRIFAGIVLIISISWLFKKTVNERTSDNITYISNILQAYFGGPDNIAVALAINTPFSFEEAIGNIFKYIPFVMYYFRDYTSSNVIFNELYWGRPGYETQIIPMIAQSLRCFSIFLAPLLTTIISSISIKQEIKGFKFNTINEYAIRLTVSVCFAFALFMYSGSLIIQMSLNYIFPLYVVYVVSNRIRI